MGLIKIVASIVGLLILAVIGLAAYLYFTDYEAEGTITEKGSDSSGNYVVIRPKMIPYDYRQALDANAARFVCEGYAVTYRIQSGHYTVSNEDGKLIYDSNEGLVDGLTPALDGCPVGT